MKVFRHLARCLSFQLHAFLRVQDISEKQNVASGVRRDVPGKHRLCLKWCQNPSCRGLQKIRRASNKVHHHNVDHRHSHENPVEADETDQVGSCRVMTKISKAERRCKLVSKPGRRTLQACVQIWPPQSTSPTSKPVMQSSCCRQREEARLCYIINLFFRLLAHLMMHRSHKCMYYVIVQHKKFNILRRTISTTWTNAKS